MNHNKKKMLQKSDMTQ